MSTIRTLLSKEDYFGEAFDDTEGLLFVAELGMQTHPRSQHVQERTRVT